jgi:hypothetical protein
MLALHQRFQPLLPLRSLLLLLLLLLWFHIVQLAASLQYTSWHTQVQARCIRIRSEHKRMSLYMSR